MLCIALAVAWYSSADKNRLSNIWYDQTGSIVILTFDKNGAFSTKEYDPGSGLLFTQYDGTYKILNHSTVEMNVSSSRDYSWSGGEEWDLDREETGLNYDTTFQFAINGDTLVLTRTGGPMTGPFGGVFKLDGGITKR